VITKKGTPMYFATLEDLTGQVEILVFGKVAENSGDLLKEDEVVLIDSKISFRDGEHRVSAESISLVRKEMLENEERIALTQEIAQGLDIFVEKTATKNDLQLLAETLNTLPAGPIAVIIHFQEKRIRTSHDILFDQKAKDALSELPFITLKNHV
jgi:DNA polymerase-3 subunit alpha